MAELLYSREMPENNVLTVEFSKVFSKGDSVAVKLHFGQGESRTALGPEYAKTAAAALKDIGAKPFLFDSSVVYGGPRGTPQGHSKEARKRGFDEDTIGCPLVFSDEFVVVKTNSLAAEVCKPLLDADGMLVLTHCKGHPCTGMGGAIKNLGMGGVTKKTKGEIHDRAGACYEGGCIECGVCEKICPFNAITLKDGHPEIGNCAGCDACVDNCPQGALVVKDKPFDLLISEGAQAVIKNMKKIYYINVMKNITKFCDCLSSPGDPVVPDAGVLMGTDIVAIDRASVELINNKAGRDIFKELHHKSAMGHIEDAQKLGLGRLHYTLREI